MGKSTLIEDPGNQGITLRLVIAAARMKSELGSAPVVASEDPLPKIVRLCHERGGQYLPLESTLLAS